MALSMDEQRMLAEIERRLSAEDPRLAARLSSFRRTGPATKLRSPRNRVIGTLFTVVLLAVVSMMVYAMVPFRAHAPKSATSPQASSPGISAPARVAPQTGGAGPNSPKASTHANAGVSARGVATTAKTSTVGKTSAKTVAKTPAKTSGATAASHTRARPGSPALPPG